MKDELELPPDRRPGRNGPVGKPKMRRIRPLVARGARDLASVETASGSSDERQDGSAGIPHFALVKTVR